MKGRGEHPRVPFRDRHQAGRILAEHLREHAGHADVIVLALPRGGVPVGFEVARALGADLDVLLVRKLGVPRHEELAMGAIASGGERVINDEVVASLGITQAMIDQVAAAELDELKRQERDYRAGRAAPAIEGRTVILVDDGLATGASMRAAAVALRNLGARRIVAAVPVGAPETCRQLAELADEVVCARMPAHFHAVGQWYEDFSQTTDGEVKRLLARAAQEREAEKGVGHEA